MENQNLKDIKGLEEVCKELLKESNMYEQDTIERLVVPVLWHLGWKVDGVAYSQLVRGNRDTQSYHRNFDLNLYKDRQSNSLSIGIECKVVSKNVPMDLFPISNEKTSSSNLNGINQIISDYFNEKFSDVKYGYTAAVWTNGRTWIVIRKDFEQDNCVEVPPSCVEVRCGNRIENPQLYYRKFELFDSDGNIIDGTLMKLKAEIGEHNFRNCASNTNEENVFQ
jgi:hypothetical protein